MKKLVVLVVLVVVGLFVVGCADPSPNSSNKDEGSYSEMEKNLFSATALLCTKVENAKGFWMKQICMATAFERSGEKTYRFVTAAQCVVGNDGQGMPRLFLTFDDTLTDATPFYRAELLAVGDQNLGDDFAVLEAHLDREIPTIPMANSEAKIGEHVSNVASPFGFGKHVFRGCEASDYEDWPFMLNDWLIRFGSTPLDIISGPGSSGSVAVSQNRQAIVSILVGIIRFKSSNLTISIPVTKFNRFWKDVQKHKHS